jgi:biopolymer transport protein ExbD
MADRRRPAARALERSRSNAWNALRITPMIDVVFLLLLYFMLSARFDPDEFIFRVDVPRPQTVSETADPFALPERPINVFVRSTGEGMDEFVISTDSRLLPEITSLDQFITEISLARGRALSTEQRFLVRAEAGTLWEHALTALDSVIKGDYENVRFAEPSS